MKPGPSQYDREEREIEFARALAFSDGVFAFAVTLLVTTIDVPDLSGPDLNRQLWHALGDLWPSVLSYFISFAVIGLMWMHHHRLFSRIRRLDGTTLWLNLLSLAFVVLMPFTTELLGRYNDEPVGVGVYGLNIALATGAYTLLWWSAARRGMLGETLSPSELHAELLTRLWIVGGFLLSIPIAFLSTEAAQLSWAATGFSQGVVQGRLRQRGGLPARETD